jgi:hypothetical protein
MSEDESTGRSSPLGAAIQLTTMGILCIHYGTEQQFDSGGRPAGSDVVLRENMFGGSFGGKSRQAANHKAPPGCAVFARIPPAPSARTVGQPAQQNRAARLSAEPYR